MSNVQEQANENPFLNSETIKILHDLLRTVDGRKIVKPLLRKFKELSQSFSELSESERKIVHENLNKDFREQLKALHANLVWDESQRGSVSEREDSYFEQFWVLLSFCTVILSISMCLDCFF